MKNFFKHLHTINKHRWEVFKLCVMFGIPLQGLVHDLSKYSTTEFSIYKYYDGTRSPHEVAREVLGYSPSWIHHKGRNKHHWEYWVDNYDNKNVAIKVPAKYVVEMVADTIAASKVYLGKNFTKKAPLEYFIAHAGNRLYHEDTRNEIMKLLVTYSMFEERVTAIMCRRLLKGNKKS